IASVQERLALPADVVPVSVGHHRSFTAFAEALLRVFSSAFSLRRYLAPAACSSSNISNSSSTDWICCSIGTNLTLAISPLPALVEPSAIPSRHVPSHVPGNPENPTDRDQLQRFSDTQKDRQIRQ